MELASEKLLSFERGTTIFKEGDHGADMYLVKSGEIEIYRVRHGIRIQLSLIGPGEVFGILATLGNHERAAAADAIQKSEIVVIPSKHLEAVLQTTPAWLKVLIKNLISTVNNINDKYVTAAIELDKHIKKK